MKGVVPDIVIRSVLDVMEVGEEYLPHAMPWTVISMADYHPVADLSPWIPGLRLSSEARRAKDPRFMAQNDVINRVKQHQDVSDISLNLKARVELAREEKGLDKAQDEVLGEEDSAKEPARRISDKDFVLKEAGHILVDLARRWNAKE